MTDNMKFWTFLTTMILAVAVAITLIDLTIKAAILEESNSLRRMIVNLTEEWGNDGQEKHGRVDARDSANGHHNGNLPSDVLAQRPTGLEERSANIGDQKPLPTTPRKRRATRPPIGNREIPPGD
jgi:hypothetical protein